MRFVEFLTEVKNMNVDFSTLKDHEVGAVTDVEYHSFPRPSQYDDTQSTVPVTLSVNHLPYDVTAVFDTETKEVQGVINHVGPGYAHVVSFVGDDVKIDGRVPNTGPRKMFSRDYHHVWFGEGRDKRSPTEKFGKLD